MANPKINFNPRISGKNLGKTSGELETLAKTYNDAIDQGQGIGGLFPTYSTGARSYIRVGGKPIAVCMDFRWQISAQATEIRTIDTNLPWDLVPNQIIVNATLNQIIDPRSSLETQALFHTIQSTVHQPYVEMQVLDAGGQSLFFARGMFTGVSGQIARGQLSTWSATFQGVAYQHNVFQEFVPYDASMLQGTLDEVNDALGKLSSLTGGFL